MNSAQSHAVVHLLHLMVTPAPVLEQQIMEVLSLTTVTVGIVLVVVHTEDVNLVVPGQEVPHCV